MDGKTATTSFEAAEVEGEGMKAGTRRYQCLFLGGPQGAAHMRTKGPRKMVFGQGEHGLDSETALAVKLLTLTGRSVYHLGAIPVLGRSERVIGDVPECVREDCEMRDKRVEREG